MPVDESSIAWRAAVYAALGDPGRLAVVDALPLGDRSPGSWAGCWGCRRICWRIICGCWSRSGWSSGPGPRPISGGPMSGWCHRRLPAAPVEAVAAPRVVFVCTHNSARSQFASALWARRSAVPVASAGTHPARRVHRRAASVGPTARVAVGRGPDGGRGGRGAAGRPGRGGVRQRVRGARRRRSCTGRCPIRFGRTRRRRSSGLSRRSSSASTGWPRRSRHRRRRARD